MTIIDSTREARFVAPFSPVKKLLNHGSGSIQVWAEWQRRRRYRKDLKRLILAGPHMIEDIGLTLEEARREIQKSSWRA